MSFLFGFLAAACIAILAYRIHALSKTGAWAAILVGTIIFGAGGWPWAILLLAFFTSSTALTRAFKKRKTGVSEKFSKGGQRDAGQVWGNGGLVTLFAGLNFFLPGQSWVWLAFAAALAAVNADTWATELGVLNPHPPRMLTDLRKTVEKGTSGGVSLVGSLAALGGSALIGLLAGALHPQPISWTTVGIVTLAGVLGAFFDSFIGATVQAMYYCPTCHKETERHPLHTCGTYTTLKRGWDWLNNDWVNFACGAFAVAAALALSLLGG